MIKHLIDSCFAAYYNLHRRPEVIDDHHTNDASFDLEDNVGNPIVSFGAGIASFSNNMSKNIMVLEYERYIDKYNRTKFHSGRKKCDFVLEEDDGTTVILNELTSSSAGMKNLVKPIVDKKNTYQGGKFEKAEKQLLESLKTLHDIPAIGSYLAGINKKICLCSYKLNMGVNLSAIGNPVKTFSLGQTLAGRLVGEDGILISSPDIEKLGFEYRRISHDYAFKL